jgi:3',5'-cyclic AMP phosphodiesterase CpdA
VPLLAHDDEHEHAQEHKTPRRVDDKEIYKPSAVPDRIILTWTGDPAHSQAVTWRTDESVTEAVAEIAESEPGPKFADKANRVAAHTEKLESDAGIAHYHTVNFENLKPKTKYAYRVGDRANWSEWFQFVTASDQPEPFSFVYFGDAQNAVRMHWSRVIREAFTDAPKARFLLHAGDLINSANHDSEWGEWFAAGAWLNAMIPNVATPGNHEYGRVGLARKLSKHWRPQFALPENGPSGLEETVYTLDFQGVRIVSLNSNEQHVRQVEWLDKVLADNPNRWTVVTFHHPVYSTARGRDNPQIRRLWKPLFDKYRVDLVLQGHDHSYSRVGPDVPEEVRNVPTGATVQSPEAGTIYVVSISGPKMYRLERESFMKRAAEGVQLYQIIHVDGDRLRYEARTADGKLYDAFTLVKRPGQTNQVIDEAPQTPEFSRETAESEEDEKDNGSTDKEKEKKDEKKPEPAGVKPAAR